MCILAGGWKTHRNWGLVSFVGVWGWNSILRLFDVGWLTYIQPMVVFIVYPLLGYLLPTNARLGSERTQLWLQLL